VLVGHIEIDVSACLISQERIAMTFKYAEGQAVEYTPMRGLPALFKIIRQMPEESQAARKYRIKSEGEGFERNVLESDLGATDIRAA
jgi:hypothetical protein